MVIGLCSHSDRGLNRATMRREAVLHSLIAQAECDFYYINPVSIGVTEVHHQDISPLSLSSMAARNGNLAS